MIKKLIRNDAGLYLRYRMLRMWLRYRLWGYRDVHKTANFLGRSRISKDIKAGAYSSIGPEAWIAPRVTLGKYVLVAPRVTIKGDDHFYDEVGVPIIFGGRPRLKETVIEDDAWIGQNVSIRAGIVIGRGAIVGMGAVVTKDVAPYTIVGGVPAKKIGMRFEDAESIAKHDQMLAQPAEMGRYCDRK